MTDKYSLAALTRVLDAFDPLADKVDSVNLLRLKGWDDERYSIYLSSFERCEGHANLDAYIVRMRYERSMIYPNGK
jgi:hypothetical protein